MKIIRKIFSDKFRPLKTALDALKSGIPPDKVVSHLEDSIRKVNNKTGIYTFNVNQPNHTTADKIHKQAVGKVRRAEKIIKKWSKK